MKRLIIIIGIIILIIYGITNIGNIKEIGEKEKTLELKSSIPREEGSLYKLEDDKLIKFEERKLTVIELNKEKREEEKEEKSLVLDIDNPIMDISEEYIYIADKDKGEIYQIDLNMEVKERFPLKKELMNRKISNGNIIYHIKDVGEDMETIGVINKEGQHVSKHNFLGNVSNYCSGQREGDLAVATIEEKLGDLCSVLKVYDDMEEVQSLDFKEQIIMDLKIISRREMLVLTEKTLSSVSKGELNWTKELSLLKGTEIYDKDIYALTGSKVQVINTRGEIIRDIDLEREFDKIKVYNPKKSEIKLILYDDLGLEVYGEDGVELSWDGEIEEIMTSGEDIFILDSEKCGIYEINYVEVE